MAVEEKSYQDLKELSKRLLKACKANPLDLAEVEKLIEAGASTTYAAAWSGKTPLEVACSRNSVPLAKILIAHGALKNPGEGGWPMFKAVGKGELELVSLFLGQGVKPQDFEVSTAIDARNKEMLGLLLATDVDLGATLKGSTKNAALHQAEKTGDPRIIQMVRDALARRAEQSAQPLPDPKDARIAALEAQIRSLAGCLTSMQAELDDIKNPGPALIDKKKLPSPSHT